MKEKPLILGLVAVLLLMGWVRSHLEDAFRAGISNRPLGESLSIIARHGGTLDGDSGTLASDSLAAALEVPLEHAQPDGDSFASGTSGEHHAFHHASHQDNHPDEDHHAEHTPADPAISTGLLLILHQLGLGELAANLLWIQMDSDSHSGLWHRVNFYLELIPSLDPHFIEAFLLRAHILDRVHGKTDAAIALLEKAIRQNPLRTELYIQTGMYAFNFQGIHKGGRNLPKALHMFEQSLRLPDPPPYIARFYAFVLAAMNRRDEAIAFLELVQKLPSQPPTEREHDTRAIARIRNGEQF